MKSTLTALFNMVATMSPVIRALLGACSVFLAINSYVNTLWANLFSRIDAIAAGSAGSANFAPCALANYVFPLDTILTFITAYATLRLACASVRIVKSFIPTIA